MHFERLYKPRPRNAQDGGMRIALAPPQPSLCLFSVYHPLLLRHRREVVLAIQTEHQETRVQLLLLNAMNWINKNNFIFLLRGSLLAACRGDIAPLILRCDQDKCNQLKCISQSRPINNNINSQCHLLLSSQTKFANKKGCVFFHTVGLT